LARLRYEERAALAQNPLGRQLFELMVRKKTNLSVAADVETVDQMLELAEKASQGVAAGLHGPALVARRHALRGGTCCCIAGWHSALCTLPIARALHGLARPPMRHVLGD
jgi:hypothetical protein